MPDFTYKELSLSAVSPGGDGLMPLVSGDRKRARGYGGVKGCHAGNIKKGGKWVGEGNNRRFLPYKVNCPHAEDCELCPLEDCCFDKTRGYPQSSPSAGRKFLHTTGKEL